MSEPTGTDRTEHALRAESALRGASADTALPVDAESLAAAYPWRDDARWTRLAMLRCVDGAVAGADGRSRSVSSATDRAVLGEIRRLADAIVTGAATMRAEPYGPLRVLTGDGGRTASERARLCLAPAPRLVVVTRTLDLPWDAPVFAESALPVLVVTGPGAPADAVRSVSRHAEIVRLDDDVTPAALVAELRERGMGRIVCEGGPSLASAFAASGLLDEVDLTIAPWVGGMGAGPGVGGRSAAVRMDRMRLVHALTDDGFVFLRYVRGTRG